MTSRSEMPEAARRIHAAPVAGARRSFPAALLLVCFATLGSLACEQPASDPAATTAETAPAVPPPVAPAPPASEPQVDERGVEYSADYFSNNIETWNEVLGPLKGAAGLRYLEVGLFEGRSAIWMLDNVLTHPSSHLTGIDLFPEGTNYKEIYLRNLERSGHIERATTITGYSQTELRSLPLESFDLIYIDGSHTADDVLADLVLSWDLLKPGGLVILDDYGLAPFLPHELRPQLAIDAFIMAYRHEIEVVHRVYQMILRKVSHPCPVKSHCSPIGPYLYLWETQELVAQEGGESIALTDAEKTLLVDTILSERFDGSRFAIAAAVLADPAHREFIDRLQLESGASSEDN